MTLQEVARELGVETHETQPYANDECHDLECVDCYYKRPDLDIAHDVLPKLLATDYGWRYEVRTVDGAHWHLVEARGSNRQIVFTGTFIECVSALAERYIRSKS